MSEAGRPIQIAVNAPGKLLFVQENVIYCCDKIYTIIYLILKYLILILNYTWRYSGAYHNVGS